MDYQQNVRMILTEETHSATNVCTMETTRASAEEPIFGQTGTGNEVAGTRYSNSGTGWTGNTSASVSRLGNLAGKNIGPNTLQKVMAGDRVSAWTDYYYASPGNTDNPNIVANVLNSLMQAVAGGSAAGTIVKMGAAGISSQLNNLPGFIDAVKPAGTGTTPLAYLTILFFDERFNFIKAEDGGLSQSQVASTVTASGAQLSQLNIKAPRNGYVYVYVSNRSDQNVYFDNFKVTIQTGNIIEENHYYSYGLKIAAISSRKLPDANEGNIKNNNLYNDKELWDDGDLNWYDYGFRDYDPQIGRFPQLDPLTDAYGFFSPYLYGGNDPIANIDFMGLGPETGFATGIGANLIGDATTIGSTAFLTGLKAVSATTATVSAVSKGFSTFSLIANVSSILIHTSILASNLLNTNVTTTGVGPGPILRGIGDAYGSALWWGFWKNDNLDDYDDPQDQKDYLIGRIVGDAAAAAQGHTEIVSGGGIALGSGGTLAVAGGGLAVHGGGMIIVAEKDVIWVTQKLVSLGMTEAAIQNAVVKYSAPKNEQTKSNSQKSAPPNKVKQELPTLDQTGKVHGDLPEIQDLKKYSKDDLTQFLKDLQKSVRQRIKSTIRKGPESTRMQNRSHGQRQAAEQHLIKAIQKLLNK